MSIMSFRLIRSISSVLLNTLVISLTPIRPIDQSIRSMEPFKSTKSLKNEPKSVPTYYDITRYNNVFFLLSTQHLKN